MVEMSVLWLRRSALLALMAGLALGADPANVAELRRGFEHPPDDARIMVRWWWFGPAVTKAELEREMRLMKEGGIGGFEVQPAYPLAARQSGEGLPQPAVHDRRSSWTCSRFTGEKAKELGLRMDLTLGSGWPFGGPHIPVGARRRRGCAWHERAAPNLPRRRETHGGVRRRGGQADRGEDAQR